MMEMTHEHLLDTIFFLEYKYSSYSTSNLIQRTAQPYSIYQSNQQSISTSKRSTGDSTVKYKLPYSRQISSPPSSPITVHLLTRNQRHTAQARIRTSSKSPQKTKCQQQKAPQRVLPPRLSIQEHRRQSERRQQRRLWSIKHQRCNQHYRKEPGLEIPHVQELDSLRIGTACGRNSDLQKVGLWTCQLWGLHDWQYEHNELGELDWWCSAEIGILTEMAAWTR